MLVRNGLKRSLFVSVVACVWIAGCQDYKWQWSFQSPDDMQKVEEQAAKEGRLIFIFYKFYLDSDANRMHGDVLADNTVGLLFNDSVNILVDKAAGPEYERHLTKYGVTSPPACILVAPDGRYKVLTGYLPKEQFIEMVKSAKAELMAPRKQPASSKISR